MVRTAREAAVRPTWSPWLTTAVALAWLVVLAVLVDGVGLVLQLWLVSVGAAVLVGLRLARRPAAEKAEPAIDNAEAPEGDSERVDEDSSEPGEEDSEEPATKAKPGPTPACQPAPRMAPEAAISLEVWTATDVARVLQVPLQAVISEMSSGRMPGNTVAGEWRVRAAALVDWLDGAYSERHAQS